MSPAPVVETFRKLHESGCFTMPNPWDPGSAHFLAQLGFPALATTSAGFAYSRALPDAVTAVPCELMLAHVAEMVAATALPVNADFQNAYADEPEGVADNVARCVRAGVAGVSVEDATGEGKLYAPEVAVERVRAARRAIDASGTGVVLTARCEAYLVGEPDARRVALERLVAFADAGADCLFAPGVRDVGAIAEMVKAVAPRAVNVLVSRPGLSVAELAGVGVRRVSVGSALARVAWGAFMRAARELREGRFDAFAGGAGFDELEALFGGRVA